MFLDRLYIEDYKSIAKLNWALTDPLTCLVGQNESGKSSLLEVFHFLDYKRHALNYLKHTRRGSDRYVKRQIPVLRFYFQVSEEEIATLYSYFAKPQFGQTGIRQKMRTMTLNRLIIEFAGKNSKVPSARLIGESVSIDLTTLIPQEIYASSLDVILKPITKIIRIDETSKVKFSALLADIISGNAKDTSIFKLLKISGLDVPKEFPTEKREIKQYLRGLNKNLNNNFVRKYYSQDESVQFLFGYDSEELILEIEDGSESSFSIDERSEGFQHFFNILIEMALLETENSDVLFLLDEPGLRLHPSGQKDLLKYLEDLARNSRIIYTTHSPFLINRLHPNRVRIVDKNHTTGTDFKFKGFSKNWKPMRSSLGLNIKDSFYYSDKALVVEGPEDIIYLSSLIHYFNSLDAISFNTDLFSFIDSGGESNLPSMVQIIMDDDRPTLILMDSDSPSTANKLRKKVKEVNNTNILDLFEINEFKDSAVSIEDLLPSDILAKATANYCKELEEHGVLKPRQSKSVFALELKEEDSSRYKDIAKKVIEHFVEVDLPEEDWLRKKVPISKLGIARHFEIIITDPTFKNSNDNFAHCLSLLKEVSSRMGLSEEVDN